MSGILGLLSPDGADAGELQTAAGSAAYRGSAQIRAVGPLLVGVIARDDEPAWSVDTSASVLCADARIDAVLPGTVADRLAGAHGGLSLLAAVLDESGPAGLEGLAADFALARWDRGGQQVLLSRDAFGLRPLYWACQDGRIGFAPDPAVLIALGLASGDIDFGVAAARLSGLDPAGERTPFAGVHRVPGGRWISFDTAGNMRRGRWFRPEDVPLGSSTLQEAAGLVRGQVVAAVASRARGERSALLLSGGRDSGAVAVASAIAGIRQECLTLRLDPDSDPSEEEAARTLAESLGHGWGSFHVRSVVERQELEEIPDLTGDPLSYPAFPMATAYRQAAVDAAASLVLDGEGGDYLFTAHTVAVLDLASSGRLQAALSATTAYHRNWIYGYPRIAKSVLRAVAPFPLLNARERIRPRMPWARIPVPRVTPLAAPRNSRDYLIRSLLHVGGSAYLELAEQLFQRAGIRYACPLFDQRVVRAALGLPVGLRVPLPGPKPVLAAALLGGFDRSRVKANHRPYYTSLAGSLHEDFPWLFDSGSLCERLGLVKRGALIGLDSSLVWGTLLVVPFEMWLRREERENARR